MSFVQIGSLVSINWASDDVLFIQVVIAKRYPGHPVCRLEAKFMQIIVVGVVGGDGLLLLLLPLMVS